MKRTIEVVTLSFERIDSILVVELGLWNGSWIILGALDEDGVDVEVLKTEAAELKARAAAGEDETGED